MLSKHLSDAFTRNTAVAFVTNMIAAFLSYLVHPVLARLLSVADYGEAQALMTIYGTLAIPIGIFSAVVVNIVANRDEHNHEDLVSRNRLIAELGRVLRIGGTVLILAIALGSPFIAKFFHFSSAWPVLAVAATFVVAVWGLFRRAYLRGVKDFLSVGISQIIETGVRLVAAAAFVAMGWRVLGAMFGVVVAQACSFWFVYERTKKGYSPQHISAGEPRPDIKPELRFAFWVMASSAAAMVLCTADVLVIKRYFSPTEAGLYGGIATVARIVLFVSGPVVAVLTSHVTVRQPHDENRRLLLKALGLTCLIGGPALAFFALFPDFAMRLLLGARYAANSALLPKVSLLMFLASLTSPMFAYRLALRQKSAAIIGLVGAFGIIILCVARHATLETVINNFLLGMTLVLLAFLGHAGVVHRKAPAHAA